MSRALPGSIIAAVGAAGAQPSLSVTLSDPRVIPSLFASSGAQDNTTRVDLCLDPSGTILETLTPQTDPATIQIRRITSPITPAQWLAAPTNLAAGARGFAGARIFSAGGTCRLVYQRSVDELPVYRDSIDVGLTWGAETVLGPGTLPLPAGFGFNFVDDFAWNGTSIDTIWVVCRAWTNPLNGASGMIKTIRTAGVWGAWTPEGPLTATWGQMRRVSSIVTPAGQLYLAGMMKRNTLSGFGAAFFTRAGGAFNSAPMFLQDMDNPSLGLSYAWSAADGNSVNGYWAAVTLVDDGSVSTNPRQLTQVYFSPAPNAPSDRSWQPLCALPSSATPVFGFGICADPNTQVVYLAGKTQVWTIPMVPAVVVQDLSPDVLSLHVSERPNQPARAKLVLSNGSSAPVPTEVDVAQGHPGGYTAESVFGAFVAANAFDGNDATAWGSNTHFASWLQVDLGAPHTIHESRVFQPGYATNPFTGYQIQGSPDGITWTVIATQNAAPADDTLAFTGATYRYWRLNITAMGAWGSTVGTFALFETQMISGAPADFTGNFAGSQLVIGLGYNGTTVPCWTFVVEDTRLLAAGDSQTAEWDLLDQSSFLLSRISQRFMALSSYTVSALFTFIAQLANLPITLPGTSPLTQVVPCFVIKPGESPLDALGRLCNLYELTWQVRASGALLITDPQAADAPSWTYGQEALGAGYGSVVDVPNVIRVIGDSPTAWSEVQDDANIQATGVVVSRLIVDRLITTAAAAKVRAAQALRQEQISAAHGQLTVTINPQLELSDVLQVSDARVGLALTHLRIAAIDTLVDWHSGAWAQHVDLVNP